MKIESRGADAARRVISSFDSASLSLPLPPLAAYKIFFPEVLLLARAFVLSRPVHKTEQTWA